MRVWLIRLALLGCIFGLWSTALATKVVISAEEPSSLELRQVTLPDGSDVEYYVIKGNPVRLVIDETQEVTAKHIEFDRTNKVVRIIGYGSITTEDQSTSGDNLVFELDSETFQGQDVLIITNEIDVLGVDANRVPGQISVLTGEFSPCSRCGQKVEDYSFKAERLELFPGDRLVAFDVQIRIKDFPIFYLPLLVVPLGPPDRQPQLTLNAGTESSRAEVFLSWPYVSGANALGYVTLRYWADVDVGQGNFFSNTFLGGAVETNYLGGEINHRFYTDTGKGSFDLAYTPSFVDTTQTDKKTDELFKVRFQYDSEENLSSPQINLLISRDDDLRRGIAEFTLQMRNSISGIRGQFDGRGFLDFVPEDDIVDPSYGSPRRGLELNLSPEQETFSVGPFSASGINLNLGFFEGLSNSSNRSAAVSRTQLAGRLVESHNLSIEPQRPWSGLEFSANSSFQGQYYTTGERLILWNTSANLSQSFGIGSIRFDFNRNINEGETPFAFDARSLGNISSLGGNLTLTPFDWLNFSSSTRYVFLNDRSREAEGFDPLVTSLTFFNNLNWINLSFSNSYDFSEDSFDPGNLKTELGLRSPDTSVDANLTVTFIKDLNPNFPERLGPGNDESELDVSLNFGLRPYLLFDMSGGYVFDPPEPEEGAKAYNKDLTLGLTVGTEDQEDLIPSVRVGLSRDLNNHETSTVSLKATAAVQPVEVSLEQTFNVADQVLGASNYRVTWKNIAQLEASGFALIPAGLLGLEFAPDRTELWRVDLAENRLEGEARWRLTYESTHAYGERSCSALTDPLEVEVCDSKLTGFVNLDETRLGPFYFGVDFDSTFLLADDSQALNYLSQANLLFFTDIASTVGIQGNLQYAATASETEITQSTLRFNDFAITARFLNDFYLSMILGNDSDGETWVLSDSLSEPSFNFQPEFRLTWNRCCWALYSSWDSATGTLSITLTTPGGTEGLGGTFEDTPLKLPGESTNQP